MATLGNFTFVLHAHLPYVLSHGRWPHGTDWLSEAASETYIPILDVLTDLVAEGISPKLTMGITPVLSEQMAHRAFRAELGSFLAIKIKSAIADRRAFLRVGDRQMADLARMWERYFTRIRDHYRDHYGEDIVGAFRQLQDQGHIEIITCAATHGYLPLLGRDVSVQAQIKQAVATHTRLYRRPPRGMWLPECAYRPRYEWSPPVGTPQKPALRKGVEEFLSENGIEYFITDSAMLRGGRAIGAYLERFEGLQQLWERFSSGYVERDVAVEKTPRAAYFVHSSPSEIPPVAVLTRDPDTALQVWSGQHGYPGDGMYLDFHKKRFPGGHRYWRVTSAGSDLADKEPYEPERAAARIPENADHFVDLIREELSTYHQETGAKGIVCAPYDAELFGHWWYEGPEFLRHVLRRIALDPEVALTTGSRFIEETPPVDVVSLPEGSWGEGGYHYIWLNEHTEWSWKHIYQDEARMQELAQTYGSSSDPKLQGILQQAGRELLLLQASDWQFLISTKSALDYAELRLVEHHECFQRLAKMAQTYEEKGELPQGDWHFLEECSQRDQLFEELDVRWFAEVAVPAEA
ncbi:MAG: 1,4-alpha-glucan branching protein domain-containing protein [Candidatus Latescibacterota bacterium]